jgi:hypothetical protein
MTLLLHSMPFSQVMSQFILPLYDKKKKNWIDPISISVEGTTKKQRIFITKYLFISLVGDYAKFL